jgi:hypothetical protein
MRISAGFGAAYTLLSARVSKSGSREPKRAPDRFWCDDVPSRERPTLFRVDAAKSASTKFFVTRIAVVCHGSKRHSIRTWIGPLLLKEHEGRAGLSVTNAVPAAHGVGGTNT